MDGPVAVSVRRVAEEVLVSIPSLPSRGHALVLGCLLGAELVSRALEQPGLPRLVQAVAGGVALSVDEGRRLLAVLRPWGLGRMPARAVLPGLRAAAGTGA